MFSLLSSASPLLFLSIAITPDYSLSIRGPLLLPSSTSSSISVFPTLSFSISQFVFFRLTLVKPFLSRSIVLLSFSLSSRISLSESVPPLSDTSSLSLLHVFPLLFALLISLLSLLLFESLLCRCIFPSPSSTSSINPPRDLYLLWDFLSFPAHPFFPFLPFVFSFPSFRFSQISTLSFLSRSSAKTSFT